MDDDLNEMSREALIETVKRLRAGIRKHRDSSGHDLCWFHPQLWGLLPRTHRARSRGAAMAKILARLRGVSQQPRQGIARRTDGRRRIWRTMSRRVAALAESVRSRCGRQGQ